MRTFPILAALVLLSSNTVFAAPKAGGGGGGRSTGGGSFFKSPPMVWVAFGMGTSKIKSPANNIDNEGFQYFEAGGQLRMWGRLFIPFGAFASLNAGKMQYRFLGPDNTNYSANDVDYQLIGAGMRMGLQYRFLYTQHFRMYGEAGLYASGDTATYKVKTNTALAAQGSKFASETRDLIDSGWYAEGGMDIVFQHYGLRLAGRRHMGSTGRVDALNKQKIKYEASFAYAALIKEF